MVIALYWPGIVVSVMVMMMVLRPSSVRIIPTLVPAMTCAIAMPVFFIIRTITTMTPPMLRPIAVMVVERAASISHGDIFVRVVSAAAVTMIAGVHLVGLRITRCWNACAIHVLWEV